MRLLRLLRCGVLLLEVFSVNIVNIEATSFQYIILNQFNGPSAGIILTRVRFTKYHDLRKPVSMYSQQVDQF